MFGVPLAALPVQQRRSSDPDDRDPSSQMFAPHVALPQTVDSREARAAFESLCEKVLMVCDPSKCIQPQFLGFNETDAAVYVARLKDALQQALPPTDIALSKVAISMGLIYQKAPMTVQSALTQSKRTGASVRLASNLETRVIICDDLHTLTCVLRFVHENLRVVGLVDLTSGVPLDSSIRADSNLSAVASTRAHGQGYRGVEVHAVAKGSSEDLDLIVEIQLHLIQKSLPDGSTQMPFSPRQKKSNSKDIGKGVRAQAREGTAAPIVLASAARPLSKVSARS